MKFLQTLLEDKAEYIANQMKEKLERAFQQDNGRTPQGVDDAESIVRYMNQHVDPKGLQWVANQYTKGNFRLEDVPRVGKEVASFRKYQRKLEKKDLNQYSTPVELYQAVASVEGEHTSNRAEKVAVKHEGATTIIDNPNFKVIELHNYEAACHYGKGTKWCTTGEYDDGRENFEHYSEDGPLFIVLATGEDGKQRKFQFHFESGQLMDEMDSPIEGNHQEIDFLSQFPGWAKFLNMMIDKHYTPHIEAAKKAQTNEGRNLTFKNFLIEQST